MKSTPSQHSQNQPTDQFKDHFSTLAAGYARFRPSYPDALFAYLASLAPSRECAWDCATGSGQAAMALAPHFERVIATDASADQISHAATAPNVEYRVAAAERSGLGAASIDLLTVAQAAHWFDFERFYAEARRVLRPRGMVALWTYTLARVRPLTALDVESRIDEALKEFYQAIDAYWPPERRWVDDEYRSLPFPFDEIMPDKPFTMTAEWTRQDLMGYFRTWSSVKEFRKAHQHDPVDDAERSLEALWGSDEIKTVSWQVFMRVGRVGRVGE